MTKLREAAQQALDVLFRASSYYDTYAELDALRAALEQPEQEPVAWMDREGDIYRMPEIKNWAPPHTLLYTAPPQREWQGLTDEERIAAIESVYVQIPFDLKKARAIEAKLKEKNT
jgi:hypothetical protein